MDGPIDEHRQVMDYFESDDWARKLATARAARARVLDARRAAPPAGDGPVPVSAPAGAASRDPPVPMLEDWPKILRPVAPPKAGPTASRRKDRSGGMRAAVRGALLGTGAALVGAAVLWTLSGRDVPLADGPGDIAVEGGRGGEETPPAGLQGTAGTGTSDLRPRTPDAAPTGGSRADGPATLLTALPATRRTPPSSALTYPPDVPKLAAAVAGDPAAALPAAPADEALAALSATKSAPPSAAELTAPPAAVLGTGTGRAVPGDGGAPAADRIARLLRDRRLTLVATEGQPTIMADLRQAGAAALTFRATPFRAAETTVHYFREADAETARILAGLLDGSALDLIGFRPAPPAGTVEIHLAGSE